MNLISNSKIKAMSLKCSSSNNGNHNVGVSFSGISNNIQQVGEYLFQQSVKNFFQTKQDLLISYQKHNELSCKKDKLMIFNRELLEFKNNEILEMALIKELLEYDGDNDVIVEIKKNLLSLKNNTSNNLSKTVLEIERLIKIVTDRRFPTHNLNNMSLFLKENLFAYFFKDLHIIETKLCQINFVNVYNLDQDGNYSFKYDVKKRYFIKNSNHNSCLNEIFSNIDVTNIDFLLEKGDLISIINVDSKKVKLANIEIKKTGKQQHIKKVIEFKQTILKGLEELTKLHSDLGNKKKEYKDGKEEHQYIRTKHYANNFHTKFDSQSQELVKQIKNLRKLELELISEGVLQNFSDVKELIQPLQEAVKSRIMSALKHCKKNLDEISKLTNERNQIKSEIQEQENLLNSLIKNINPQNSYLSQSNLELVQKKELLQKKESEILKYNERYNNYYEHSLKEFKLSKDISIALGEEFLDDQVIDFIINNHEFNFSLLKTQTNINGEFTEISSFIKGINIIEFDIDELNEKIMNNMTEITEFFESLKEMIKKKLCLSLFNKNDTKILKDRFNKTTISELLEIDDSFSTLCSHFQDKINLINIKLKDDKLIIENLIPNEINEKKISDLKQELNYLNDVLAFFNDKLFGIQKNYFNHINEIFSLEKHDIKIKLSKIKEMGNPKIFYNYLIHIILKESDIIYDNLEYFNYNLFIILNKVAEIYPNSVDINNGFGDKINICNKVIYLWLVQGFNNINPENFSKILEFSNKFKYDIKSYELVVKNYVNNKVEDLKIYNEDKSVYELEKDKMMDMRNFVHCSELIRQEFCRAGIQWNEKNNEVITTFCERLCIQNPIKMSQDAIKIAVDDPFSPIINANNPNVNNPNVNNSPINNTNDINGESNIMGTLKSFGLMIPSVVSLVILSSTLLNANQSMAMMNMLGAVAAVCLLIISIHVMRSRQNFKSFTSKKGITALSALVLNITSIVLSFVPSLKFYSVLVLLVALVLSILSSFVFEEKVTVSA